MSLPTHRLQPKGSELCTLPRSRRWKAEQAERLYPNAGMKQKKERKRSLDDLAASFFFPLSRASFPLREKTHFAPLLFSRPNAPLFAPKSLPLISPRMSHFIESRKNNERKKKQADQQQRQQRNAPSPSRSSLLPAAAAPPWGPAPRRRRRRRLEPVEPAAPGRPHARGPARSRLRGEGGGLRGSERRRRRRRRSSVG